MSSNVSVTLLTNMGSSRCTHCSKPRAGESTVLPLLNSVVWLLWQCDCILMRHFMTLRWCTPRRYKCVIKSINHCSDVNISR